MTDGVPGGKTAGPFFAHFAPFPLTAEEKTDTIKCVKRKEEDEYPIRTAQRAAVLVKGGEGR